MKRSFWSSIFILFITTILFSSISFADNDLHISRWLVDAELLKNGDLKISEDITFNFNSDFNGVYRDIVLSETDGIKDISVSEMDKSKEIIYREVPKAKNGDKDKFTLKEKKQNIEIKIFSPSESEKKTFRLKYTIKNVAAKHSDTAELYYKFLGKENKSLIDYFSVNLTLPQFEKDKINIFAHGPKEGKIYFSDGIIKSEVRDLASKELVENRILFPKEYIPFSKNIGKKSFKEIVEEEKSIAEKTEKDIETRAIRKKLFSKISIYLSILGAFLFLFLFYKFRRSRDVFDLMTSPYPDNLTAAELSLFINKAILPRSFLASLIELASEGHITIKEIEGDDTSKEYSFIRTDSPLENLQSHEVFLLDWFFNKIENKTTITTLDLEKYRSKNPTRFFTFQAEWNQLVKKDLKSRDYYDSSARKWSILVIALSLVWISIGVISLVFQSLYGIIPLIIGIALFFYGLFLAYRNNDKGYIQYNLWNSFKKEMETKGSESLDLDEDKALIYAIALDLPMESLNTFRTNIADDYYPLAWGYLFFLPNPSGGSQFEDSFTHSFYGYDSSSSSNLSGGGGFTGGGGAGAGGGGAGGF